MSPAEMAAIRERYQRTGTQKPLWQEVCIDIAALLAEVDALQAERAGAITHTTALMQENVTLLRWQSVASDAHVEHLCAIIRALAVSDETPRTLRELSSLGVEDEVRRVVAAEQVNREKSEASAKAWRKRAEYAEANLAEVDRLGAKPGDGNVAAMADLVELPMPTMKCEKCRGTGILRQYPRDSRWCERCKGTGAIAVHPTHVLSYGCNRCQTTWDKPNPPYCTVCGADATHYREASEMSFATELRALQDAWVAPPFGERLVLTEEAQWVRLLEQCYARAKAGCSTCGYTLVAAIETEEQYNVFMAMRERFRARLEAEGLRMQELRAVPWKATYKNAYGDDCPTSYDIHFVVTWR